MKKEELKPCPFCGSFNIEYDPHEIVGNVYYQVRCSDCLCGTGVNQRHQVVKQWNKRINDVQV